MCQAKIAAGDILLLFFFLFIVIIIIIIIFNFCVCGGGGGVSEKINFNDISCESSADSHEISRYIYQNVVCCSCDWRFKG